MELQETRGTQLNRKAPPSQHQGVGAEGTSAARGLLGWQDVYKRVHGCAGLTKTPGHNGEVNES